MVRNFYQPTPPVDWTEKLSEVYARQSRQLEEHHANLRHRDQQMVAKAKAEDPVDTIVAVTKFIGDVKTLSNKVSAGKKKREAKAKDKVASVVEQFPEGSKEVLDAIQEYGWESGKVWKESKAYDYLKNNAQNNGAPELLQSIEKLDPREILQLREVLADMQAQRLSNRDRFDTYLNSKGNEGLLAEYNAKDSAGKQQLHNIWKNEEIQKFGLSDPLLLKVVSRDYHRQKATGKGTSQAKAFSAYSAELRHKQKTYLGITGNSANHTLNAEVLHGQILLAAGKYTDIEGGKTAIQQGTDEVLEVLHELNVNGYLPPNVLAGLKEYKFKHPAGKDGEATLDIAFMNDSQYNRFVKGWEIGASKVVGVAREAANIEADSLVGLAHTGQISQDQLDQKIQALENTGFLSSEKITQLKKINIAAQHKTVEQIQLAKVEDWSITGFYGRTQAEIDATFSNDVARNLATLRFSQLQEHLVSNKDHVGSHDSDINKLITGNPLGPGQSLGGIGGRISSELDKEAQAFQAQLVWAQYDGKNKVRPNNNIAIEVDNYKTGLWTSRGGGTTDGAGIYSFDVQAKDFVNKRVADQLTVKAEVRHRVNWTEKNDQQWRKQVTSDLNTKYEGDTKKAIADGGGLTKEDLAGVAITGEYSDRMFVIADALNTDVTTLFNNAIAKLNASGNEVDQQFTVSWGFEADPKVQGKGKKKNQQMRTPNEVILESLDLAYDRVEGVQGLRIGTLRYKLRTQGWKNLSNPERSELIGILQKSQATDPEIRPLVQAREEEKAAQLLEVNRKKAHIKANQAALAEESENNTGSYFRDTVDTRTDEELDAQFNAQPGKF